MARVATHLRVSELERHTRAAKQAPAALGDRRRHDGRAPTILKPAPPGDAGLSDANRA